jgi:sugar lactone lactonase YvrE
MDKVLKKSAKFVWLMVLLISGCLVACGLPQVESIPTETQIISMEQAVQTNGAPTETDLPLNSTPTQSPTPTFTRQELVEQVTIPDCIANNTEDQTIFHELLISLIPELFEMESFQYRTVYLYKEDNIYPEDELSIEILGTHSGKIPEPEIHGSYFYPLTTQRYERSHVIQTDLLTNEQTEYFLNQNGLFIREPDSSGWIFFEQFAPEDFLNMAEMLSPQEIYFMLTGGGGLTPGIWSEVPEMAQQETLNKNEVVHRCWILNERSEGIDGYLIHYESLYTFLTDVEVHLWTSDKDTNLVRLAISGIHNGERLSEYEGLEHEIPKDFLLWIDLYDDGNMNEFKEPTINENMVTFPSSTSGAVAIKGAPYNELPLPEDAEISNENILSEGYDPAIPREFLFPNHDSVINALETHIGSNWYDLPMERHPGYQTLTNQDQLVHFYLEEMEQRGWDLDSIFIQLGWPRYFLIFKRDQVSQVIILEELENDSTLITAILPPEEEVITAIIDGWTSFTVDNSDLLSDAVNSIAFDGKGRVWIGSGTSGGWTSFSSDGTSYEEPVIDGGISLFDGESWTHYTTSNSDLLSDDIWTMNIDSNDQLWISTYEGFNTFDGETWETISESDSGLTFASNIKTDSQGNLWLSGSNEIGVFDGEKWKTYKHLNPIRAFDFDANGTLIIATSESVYSRVGDDWIKFFATDDEQNGLQLSNILDLQFDSTGQLWLASGSEGLLVFDGETWTSHYPEEIDINLGFLVDMDIDNQDRVWLVSFSGGVYMFDPGQGWFDFTPTPIGISIENPEAFEIDQDGNIWIGSRNGVAIFTPPNP